jgi:hypothetical protein
MAEPVRAKFPTSFGVFSPTGHVVMAFPNDESAKMAQDPRGVGLGNLERSKAI